MPAAPRSPRSAPRHDRDAGGPAEVLAAKAALRQEVWDAMRAAKVARFPGAAGRIPNFTGAEAAAERLRALPQWQAARTLKANPDSAQLPVRQRALEDGKVVYMAVPRLAAPEPFFALDPDHLAESPRKAASISGAARSARRVALTELSPVDLVVMGSVAVSAGRRPARQGRRVRRPGVRAGGSGGPDRSADHVRDDCPRNPDPAGRDDPADRPRRAGRLRHHARARHRLPWPAGGAASRRHLLGRPDRGEDRSDSAARRAATPAIAGAESRWRRA